MDCTARVIDWTPKIAKVAMTIVKIDVIYGPKSSVSMAVCGKTLSRLRFDLGIIISMRIAGLVCQENSHYCSSEVENNISLWSVPCVASRLRSKNITYRNIIFVLGMCRVLSRFLRRVLSRMHLGGPL